MPKLIRLLLFSSRLLSVTAWASRWAARLSGAIIASCALLVAAEVLLRNLINTVVLNSFELSTYGFAAALAFGFAHTLVERAHIRIDVLYAWMPASLRSIVDALAIFGMTVLAATMAWYAWSVVATSIRLGAVSNSTLQMPLAIPQSLWAIGLSWFALVGCALSFNASLLLLTGRFNTLNTSFGIQRHSQDQNNEVEL